MDYQYLVPREIDCCPPTPDCCALLYRMDSASAPNGIERKCSRDIGAAVEHTLTELARRVLYCCIVLCGYSVVVDCHLRAGVPGCGPRDSTAFRRYDPKPSAHRSRTCQDALSTGLLLHTRDLQLYH